MRQNKSETLFQTLCDAVGMRWSRVPEEAEKRPDYWISVGKLRILAEVKQLDPNPRLEWTAGRPSCFRRMSVAAGAVGGHREAGISDTLASWRSLNG